MKPYTELDTIQSEQPVIHCVARTVNRCPECQRRMWWHGEQYPKGMFLCPICDAHLFPRPTEAAPEIVPDILATIDAAALRERMSTHFDTQITNGGLPQGGPQPASSDAACPEMGSGETPASRSWASVVAQLNVSPAGMAVRMAALSVACLPVAYLFALAGSRW